jgi:hypothetical protein
MRLNTQIEIPLSDFDEQQLAVILGANSGDLQEKLAAVANAAIQEYIRMFLGQKVFTRGSDFQEYRLYLLIRELFENLVPSEQQVCALFQVTTNGARSMIRSVLSKYQYDLHSAYADSLARVLNEAKSEEDGDDYEVVVHTQSLIDGLNSTLAEKNGALPAIARKKGTVSTYVIRPSSFDQLRLAYPASQQVGCSDV